MTRAFDSGSVDFYESPDLPGGVPFKAVFSKPLKVKEKDTSLRWVQPSRSPAIAR